MYANEVETTEKQKLPEIKINYRHYIIHTYICPKKPVKVKFFTNVCFNLKDIRLIFLL